MSNKLKNKVQAKQIVIKDLPVSTLNSIKSTINEVNKYAEIARQANANHAKANSNAETLLKSILEIKGHENKVAYKFEVNNDNLICTPLK